jgi:predicted transposase YbfD/YdcC
MLAITILGSICGADNWVEICDFGEAKHEWLSTFLELPNGIPSHDTFSRVFCLLDPDQFESCFRSWIQSFCDDLVGEVIAIDGKTLRGSGNRRQKVRPLHLVSAWATKQGLLLGQVKTEEHSNEITAIPQLFKMIDFRGSTVTLDAMGCQSSIAQEIIENEADYVVSLKDNQPKLHELVKAVFQIGESNDYKKMLHLRRVEKVHDHGRVETRRYTLISARDPSVFKFRWPGLKGIGKIETVRTTNHQVERIERYFLTSFSYENIDRFKEAVRKHWNIEIALHWSLDVSFKEDLNQSRIGDSAINLATVRRIALTLLKQESTHKRGITCKRKRAGWDHSYLMKIFMGGVPFTSKKAVGD